MFFREIKVSYFKVHVDQHYIILHISPTSEFYRNPLKKIYYLHGLDLSPQLTFIGIHIFWPK